MAGRWRRAFDWAFPAVARQVEKKRARKAAPVVHRRKARGYAMGEGGRLNASWQSTPTPADAEIYFAAAPMRARGRELGAGDPYARRYLRQAKKHVLGVDGMKLDAQPLNREGKPDPSAKRRIESAFKEWGKKGSCTVDGRHSLGDAAAVVLTSTIRDGEHFVEHIRGARSGNRFAYAMLLLEADFCDDRLTFIGRNGNRIFMGVESAEGGRPVGYHMLTEQPHSVLGRSAIRHRFVPAENCLHVAEFERSSQTRGVSWFSASGPPLHMLSGYRDAELVAARVGASKMGFYKTPSGGEYDSDGEEDGTEERAGSPLQEVEPGIFEELPHDWEVQTFDPQHPTTAFGPFTKEVLRAAASGLDTSYPGLANDPSDVNFSSMRLGIVDDRDGWKILQKWLAESFYSPVYLQWLEMALLSGALAPLNAAHFDRLSGHSWEGRGWGWVDPKAEGEANERDLRLGLTTASGVVASRGARLEDTLAKIAEERELYAQYGLTHPIDQAAPTGAGGGSQNESDTEDNQDAPPGDRGENPREGGAARTRRGGRGRKRGRGERAPL